MKFLPMKYPRKIPLLPAHPLIAEMPSRASSRLLVLLRIRLRRRRMGHGRFWDRSLAGIERGLLAPLDDLVDFLAMHRQFGRGLDAQFDGVLIDAQDFDGDPPVDHDA